MLNLQAHHMALFIGIAIGLLIAFARQGTTTGDGMPFSGK
jgi:hypothetical protein